VYTLLKTGDLKYATRDEFTRFMHDICDQIEFLRRDVEALHAEIRQARLDSEEQFRRMQEEWDSKNPRTTA
jgi:hypothetical protein